MNSIDLDPHSALHIGLKPDFLGPLITNNPFVAASLLCKIAKYSLIREYLEELLELPTSVLLFDIVGRLTKDIRIPSGYIVIFITIHINKIMHANTEQE